MYCKVVLCKPGPHVLGCSLLYVAALLYKLNQVAFLALVLKVGRNQRVQALFNQALDASKTLDNMRGLLVIDTDYHAQRQFGFKRILCY